MLASVALLSQKTMSGGDHRVDSGMHPHLQPASEASHGHRCLHAQAPQPQQQHPDYPSFYTCTNHDSHNCGLAVSRQVVASRQMGRLNARTDNEASLVLVFTHSTLCKLYQTSIAFIVCLHRVSAGVRRYRALSASLRVDVGFKHASKNASKNASARMNKSAVVPMYRMRTYFPQIGLSYDHSCVLGVHARYI